MKPKDSAAFHPTFNKHIEEGFKSGNSKKDTEIRVSELREAILPALKEDIQSDPDFWLSNKANMLLTIAVLSIGKPFCVWSLKSSNKLTLIMFMI